MRPSCTRSSTVSNGFSPVNGRGLRASTCSRLSRILFSKKRKFFNENCNKISTQILAALRYVIENYHIKLIKRSVRGANLSLTNIMVLSIVIESVMAYLFVKSTKSVWGCLLITTKWKHDNCNLTSAKLLYKKLH